MKAELVTYGVHPGATCRAENVEITATGSSFLFRSPWGETPVSIPLLGRFNVSNALAAMSAACARGIEPAQAAASLAKMSPVPDASKLSR